MYSTEIRHTIFTILEGKGKFMVRNFENLGGMEAERLGGYFLTLILLSVKLTHFFIFNTIAFYIFLTHFVCWKI